MLKMCAKTVEPMGKQGGKSRAYLSTLYAKSLVAPYIHSVKALFMPTVFPTFPLVSSTAPMIFSPPTEHTFYPVSTAPINNCNQINLKER